MVVRFTDGELELADLDKDSPTPHVHAALLGVSYGENSRTYEVEVYVMELYREQDNEALAVREALNNTLLIFEDLMAEVRNGFQSFGRLEVFPLLPVRPTPFIEEHNRVLVGVQATMQLQTPWTADACDSPINETGIPSIACPAASITTNADSPALSVASGASQDIAIHDTAGADVGTRSGATVTVGDTTVTVNSSAYGTTEAESTFNVEVVDDGDNPVGSLSGGKWVVPAGSTPATAELLKTGQTTSYRTGDDGDDERGRSINGYFDLLANNPFGHSKRFTGTTGGYYDDTSSGFKDVNGVAVAGKLNAFPDYIAVDWATLSTDGSNVLGYYVNSFGVSGNWNSAVDWALTLSVGAYSSGWRLINAMEAMSIIHFDTTGLALSSQPFALAVSVNIWTGTTNGFDSTTALAIIQSWHSVARNSKTSTSPQRLAVRRFTVTGTTLS